MNVTRREASVTLSLLSRICKLPSCWYNGHGTSPAKANYVISAEQETPTYFVSVSNLRSNPGATRKPDRLGRGSNGGHSKGGSCGRGQSGINIHGKRHHMLSTGGDYHLTKSPLLRERPPYTVLYSHVSIRRILSHIQLGLLDPNNVITMKDMWDMGCFTRPKAFYGVYLYGCAPDIHFPIHLQVSACDSETRACVENAGGSVQRVFYTKEGLEATIWPETYTSKKMPPPAPAHSWHPRYNGLFDSLGSIPPLMNIPQVVLRPQGDWCMLPGDTEPPAYIAAREAVRADFAKTKAVTSGY